MNARPSAEGFQALFGLRTEALFRGDHPRALYLAHQCRAFAAKLGDTHAQLEVHNMMANGLMWGGQLEASARHAEALMQGFSDDHHAEHVARYAQDPRVTVCYPKMMVSWLFDGGAGALDALNRAVQLAQEHGQPFGRALIHNTMATLSALQGDPNGVEQYGTVLVRLSATHGFPVYEASGAILLEWLAAARGDERAPARLQHRVDGLVRQGMTLARTVNLWMLSDALRRCGQKGRSREVAAEAAALGIAGGELALVGELQRMAGQLAEATETSRRMAAHHVLQRINTLNS